MSRLSGVALCIVIFALRSALADDALHFAEPSPELFEKDK